MTTDKQQTDRHNSATNYCLLIEQLRRLLYAFQKHILHLHHEKLSNVISTFTRDKTARHLFLSASLHARPRAYLLYAYTPKLFRKKDNVNTGKNVACANRPRNAKH